jgi:hypothetical protein
LLNGGIRIKQAALEGLADDKLMLGSGRLRPLFSFDDLNFEKLNDQKSKEKKKKKGYSQ